jgi:hypothetical protein
MLEQPRVQARELKWRLRIIADCETPRLPREVRRQDSAFWPAWAWSASDAWTLADTARALFANIAPEVRVVHRPSCHDRAQVFLRPCSAGSMQ